MALSKLNSLISLPVILFIIGNKDVDNNNASIKAKKARTTDSTRNCTISFLDAPITFRKPISLERITCG